MGCKQGLHKGGLLKGKKILELQYSYAPVCTPVVGHGEMGSTIGQCNTQCKEVHLGSVSAKVGCCQIQKTSPLTDTGEDTCAHYDGRSLLGFPTNMGRTYFLVYEGSDKFGTQKYERYCTSISGAAQARAGRYNMSPRRKRYGDRDWWLAYQELRDILAQ